MLSRSEASLVPEAEILRSACGLAQDDNRATGSYAFMNPKVLGVGCWAALRGPTSALKAPWQRIMRSVTMVAIGYTVDMLFAGKDIDPPGQQGWLCRRASAQELPVSQPSHRAGDRIRASCENRAGIQYPTPKRA